MPYNKQIMQINYRSTEPVNALKALKYRNIYNKNQRFVTIMGIIYFRHYSLLFLFNPVYFWMSQPVLCEWSSLVPNVRVCCRIKDLAWIQRFTPEDGRLRYSPSFTLQIWPGGSPVEAFHLICLFIVLMRPPLTSRAEMKWKSLLL